MTLLERTVQRIEPQDAACRAAAHARLEQLTMPYWALGRLMDLAEDLAGMTRSLRPPLGRKVVVTMAGDHGVVAAGVSKYPQEVTPQMVHNFANGGAGINALARAGRRTGCGCGPGRRGRPERAGGEGPDYLQARRPRYGQYCRWSSDEPRTGCALH